MKQKFSTKIKQFWNKAQTDFKAGEYNFPLLLATLSILLIFVGVRMIEFSKAEKKLTDRQDQIIEQLDAFADIQGLLAQQIEAMSSSSQSTLESLRQQTEDRLADARLAIENARLNLEDQIALQSSATKNAIDTWRTRVPQIECSFADVDPTSQEIILSRGSGTLFDIDGQPTILSNGHVFEEDNKSLIDCKVSFPDKQETFSFGPDAVSVSDTANIDLAQVALVETPGFVASRLASSTELCSARASIGDSIVIMGYPRIGSDKDITVTEGIISGFDGNFYITSAKVARGNSGGAAILVDKNCYLGIPTFATTGQVESLARILDINAI